MIGSQALTRKTLIVARVAYVLAGVFAFLLWPISMWLLCTRTRPSYGSVIASSLSEGYIASVVLGRLLKLALNHRAGVDRV